MSAETAVQGALYTALFALGLRVLDAGQQDATWPYVEIGFIVMNAWDTSPETGFEYVARIHTRSRSASMKEAKDIQGQLYDRLHRGTLTVAGYHHVLIERERSEVMRAPDGSFHGVCEYRGLIDKPA